MHMRFALAALVALVCAVPTANAGDDLRVARYTTVADNELRDLDPLAVVVQIQFPREFVTTVGDALSYLLQRSGYTLSTADKDAEHLLGLPLPESHRAIGPKKVHNIARTLVGDAYGLCINAKSRKVSVAAISSPSSCLATQLRSE